jgi:hypothetical protein
MGAPDLPVMPDDRSPRDIERQQARMPTLRRLLALISEALALTALRIGPGLADVDEVTTVRQ